MEGLSEAESELVVYVHPSQSKNVRPAILRELSSLLFKYNESLDGVVLAYKFETAPSNRARILSGVHPYFAVRLRSNLLLFSPKPDMLLEGKVVKVVRQSIHVIVLGFASAVITEQEIRKEFRFKHKNGESLYVHKHHRHHAIKVGTLIRFETKRIGSLYVKMLDPVSSVKRRTLVARSIHGISIPWDEEVLHIAGSLKSDHTGSITWLDKHSQDVTIISNKRMAETTEETRLRVSTGGSSSVNINPSIKVKKRRVSND